MALSAFWVGFFQASFYLLSHHCSFAQKCKWPICDGKRYIRHQGLPLQTCVWGCFCVCICVLLTDLARSTPPMGAIRLLAQWKAVRYSAGYGGGQSGGNDQAQRGLKTEHLVCWTCKWKIFFSTPYLRDAELKTEILWCETDNIE